MKKLPPGTMSFETIRSDDELGTYYAYHGNLAYPFFWKKTQNLSWMAYTLPFLELTTERERFPQSSFSLIEHSACPIDDPRVRDVIGKHVSLVYCPSDNLREEISSGSIIAAVRTQPMCSISSDPPGFDFGEPDGFLLEDVPIVGELTGKFGGTNYLGCCGAFSSESHSAVHPPGYSGSLPCGRALAMSAILDGTSNTVLIGESLGTIKDSIRTEAFSWAFGGVARGRGYTGWLENYNAGFYFLSDSKYSFRNGFGARHPTTVNVAFADGSTHSIYRGISVQNWYGLCGRGDGSVASSSTE